MSVRATVLLGMSGQAIIYRAPVRGLLSGQVTVQSGYCPVGLLSGRDTVFHVNVHRASVCRRCVLGEVSVGLVSARGTFRIRFEIVVLKNFANFTGKHLCWSLFVITLQAFKPATLLKRDSNTAVSFEIYEKPIFTEHLFSTFFSIDFPRWKGVGFPHIAYIVIH